MLDLRIADEDNVRADLRNSPYFFSPRDRKSPDLYKIVRDWFDKGLDIVSLNACHTLTSGIDHRWEDYIKQGKSLGSEFSLEYYEQDGFASVYSNSAEHDERPLILLRTQQVRARDKKNMPADINIIGVNKIIAPARPVEEIIKEGLDCGALVLACHIGSNCGLDFKTVSELYERKMIHGAEIEAGAGAEHNSLLRGMLSGVNLVPVTGGHSYKRAGTSYVEFSSSDIYPFSIERLRQNVVNSNFADINFGHISKMQKFFDRDIHIYASALGHILSRVKARRDEFLKAVGLRRK